MVLKRFWYNFAFKYIFLIKLEYNWLFISRNIDSSKRKEGVEEDKLTGVGGLIILNHVIRVWYLWADEISLYG